MIDYVIIQKDVWSCLSPLVFTLLMFIIVVITQIHGFIKDTQEYTNKNWKLEEFSEYEHTNITNTEREGPSVASLKSS